MEFQPPPGFDEKIKAADRDLQEAKSKYLQLQKEVETAVNEVKEIADEIQKQEDRSRVGGIVYAGNGLFSTALFLSGLALSPFTAGLSLAASAGSAAIGAGTAVAGVTHDIVRDKIVNNRLAEATKILESISKKWEDLHTLCQDVWRIWIHLG